ncbi:MAG: hypothetical protein JOY64_03555 [Alphaproteobacteria bacterium]|nr:hypothetical protein [Alphaproteobacteria bacterium]MBV8406681.1 hypothetical protein [Alphaproteobacteria bacterium]
MDKKADKDNKIEGEGSYSGARAYNDATAEFLKKGKAEEAAKEAERALDGREAAELKAAEDEGRAGDPRHVAPGNMEPGNLEKQPTSSKPSKSRSKSK